MSRPSRAATLRVLSALSAVFLLSFSLAQAHAQEASSSLTPIPPASVSQTPPPSETSVPPAPTGVFPDVPADAPYAAAVAWARDHGVIGGYADGTFQPAKAVSRVELLKMAYLGCASLPVGVTAKSDFPDLTPGAWYLPFVAQAEADSVVRGYNDGYFRPDRTVSRVEALKMIFRACRIDIYSAWGRGSFSDTPSGRWFVPYVNLATSTNLLTVEGTLFAPDTGMLRSDVAELLYRAQAALADGRIHHLADVVVNADGSRVIPAQGTGHASFYSDSLAGNGTASGDTYDPTAHTCAHPSLPFGTIVHVTNTANAKTVDCRVNDRGPYAKTRILDLSRSAFEEIAAASTGVISVTWAASVAL